MSSELIDENGRLKGIRFTVYNLLPDLLNPANTEAFICRANGLTAEQVAAARAWILSNPDIVLAQHLKIEERIAEGNPPEVREKAEQIHALFLRFRDFVKEQKRAEELDRATRQGRNDGAPRFPSFREWLAEQDAAGVTP